MSTKQTTLLSTGRDLGQWLTTYASDHVKVDSGHECTCGWLLGEHNDGPWLRHYDRALMQNLAKVLPSGVNDALGREMSSAQVAAASTGSTWCCRWRLRIRRLLGRER